MTTSDEDKWLAGTIYVAAEGRRAFPVWGHSYRGLGLVRLLRHGAPAFHSLTHLNSGHRVAAFASGLDRHEMVALATRIAEAGDWDFDNPVDGWVNRAPGLPDAVAAIKASAPLAFLPDMAVPSAPRDAEAARAVLARRESLGATTGTDGDDE